jgi:hypothetical protein
LAFAVRIEVFAKLAQVGALRVGKVWEGEWIENL